MIATMICFIWISPRLLLVRQRARLRFLVDSFSDLFHAAYIVLTPCPALRDSTGGATDCTAHFSERMRTASRARACAAGHRWTVSCNVRAEIDRKHPHSDDRKGR